MPKSMQGYWMLDQVCPRKDVVRPTSCDATGSGYLTAALSILAGPDSFVLGECDRIRGHLCEMTGRENLRVGVEKHKELAEQSILNIRKSNPALLTDSPPRVQIMAGNALSGKDTVCCLV